MFEDDGSHCKNNIFGLGGRVEELFDVQKVTDLVVNTAKVLASLYQLDSIDTRVVKEQ